MEALVTGLAVLVLILLFLGTGMWVFAGLLLVSVSSLWLLADMNLARIGTVGAGIVFRYSTTWELAAIPMFIWMGEIIFRTDISKRLFRGLSPLVDRVPGRLLHTNILGCTLFAAVSGSSAATTATIGKITTTELQQRGYDRDLSIGSLAGAGSLGLLIPPSIIMIVYGILAEVSIVRLFAAGILPGLVVAGLYSTYILLRSWLAPGMTPDAERGYSFVERLRGLLDLVPILVLMGIVLGAIYTGMATPSEAAAVGVAASLIMTCAMGQLSWRVFADSLLSAARSSCMVCIILISAAFLATAMGYLHIPTNLASTIAALDPSPLLLIVLLSLLYILLGLFLDGISIIVMSLPITLPLALLAGFDPIWFGVYLVLMVELGQITPPVGFNLFVIQGLTDEPIGRIARAAFPFFLLMCLAVAIITAYPGIALWLPAVLYG